MAGRSELPSGKPSSFRRTELRLGEPEPPAKKRIIDVAVLVEPCQLARVTGYRAMCAARWRPPASLVIVVWGASQSFARSSSGRRRQGRRWNGFLWPVGRARRQRVADARHAGVLAASFYTCRGAHAAVPPGIARFSRSSGLCCRLPESWAASLTQECVQRSLLALSGYATTTGIEMDKTRTRAYFELGCPP